jgi:sulfatase maturation enzyme AslB (radical SAM superfamily)
MADQELLNPISRPYDRLEHYQLQTGPTHEFAALPEIPVTIRNIGWTLGNDCPYRCNHCYSMNAREKGQNMTRAMIERVVDQLQINGVETVNLGGNEPLFTNGLNPRDTMLPFIIEKLVKAGIPVGLTTSGISLLWLYNHHREIFDLLKWQKFSAGLRWQQLYTLLLLLLQGKKATVNLSIPWMF